MRYYMRKLMEDRPPADIIDLLEQQGIRDFSGDMAHALVRVLQRHSIAGDMRAAKLLLDHTEAPLKQELEVTGHGGGPLRFDHGLDPLIDSLLERALAGK